MPEKVPSEAGKRIMFVRSPWGFKPYWLPPATPEEARVEMQIYCIFLAITIPLGAIVWVVGRFVFNAW